GHYMGMLAMVINALALQSQLESVGVPVRVQSAITIAEVAEPYIRRRAIHHLEKGHVVIFAAGTGNPFFTSDTAAALRAAEINADVILMGKNAVDGVYDADPKVVRGAKKFEELRHRDLLDKSLGVMDATAAALAEARDIPIIVSDISARDPLVRSRAGARQRRRGHPAQHPIAHRGAPPRSGQERAQEGRGWPRRDPHAAPSRPRRAQGEREELRRDRRRGEAHRGAAAKA